MSRLLVVNDMQLKFQENNSLFKTKDSAIANMIRDSIDNKDDVLILLDGTDGSVVRNKGSFYTSEIADVLSDIYVEHQKEYYNDYIDTFCSEFDADEDEKLLSLEEYLVMKKEEFRTKFVTTELLPYNIFIKEEPFVWQYQLSRDLVDEFELNEPYDTIDIVGVDSDDSLFTLITCLHFAYPDSKIRVLSDCCSPNRGNFNSRIKEVVNVTVK